MLPTSGPDGLWPMSPMFKRRPELAPTPSGATGGACAAGRCGTAGSSRCCVVRSSWPGSWSASSPRDVVAWSAGMVAGGLVALWITFRESPPRYVESWREGAEGERKAEKALRPLERGGWHVVHDVQNGGGNYDHVAVGPSGVYLLESKNLQGVVSVQGGVLRLARRHDPEQTAVFDRVRPRALASAARLKGEIERRTGHRVWAQAVVVFSVQEFPEGLVEDDRCVFIDGSRLCAWLG